MLGENIKIGSKFIEIDIPNKSILCIMGKNGSGKTNYLKTLLDKKCNKNIYIDKSTININSIGFVTQKNNYFEWMNTVEYMHFIGKLCKLNKNEISTRINELFNFVGLKKNNISIENLDELSLKQFGFAQALIKNPELLILDEPTNHLCPFSKRKIIDTILKLKNIMPIIISTNDFTLIKEVSDYIALIKDSNIVYLDNIKHLLKSDDNNVITFKVVGSANFNEFIKLLSMNDWCIKILGSKNCKMRIVVKDIIKAQIELTKIVADLGMAILELTTIENNLDEIFLRMIMEE